MRTAHLPWSTPRQRRGGADAGGVLLLVVVLLPALLGFAGAAVDVRNGYVVRAMLQHALDDGALSAQRWSAQAEDSATMPAGGVDDAVAEALRVARQELASEGLARATVAVGTSSGGRLTMTAESQVPTFFLGALGVRSWTVAARADTVLWSRGAADAPVVAAPVGIPADVAPPPVDASGAVPAGTGWPFVGVPVPASSAGGGDNGFAPSAPAPAAASGPPGGDLPAPDGAPACNCDSIAAGDAISAAAALDRMGVTPADPGPFAGDLTAGLGLGEMQSQEQETDPGASDPGASEAGGDPSGAADGTGAGSDGGSDSGLW